MAHQFRKHVHIILFHRALTLLKSTLTVVLLAACFLCDCLYCAFEVRGDQLRNKQLQLITALALLQMCFKDYALPHQTKLVGMCEYVWLLDRSLETIESELEKLLKVLKHLLLTCFRNVSYLEVI